METNKLSRPACKISAFFKDTLTKLIVATEKKAVRSEPPSPPPYEIYSFDGKDYRLLSTLVSAYRSWSGLNALSAAQWHDLRQEAERGTLQFYIAYVNGNAVGFCGVHRSWDPVQNAVTAFLDTLYVHDCARNRGIGHALLDAVTAFSRENGATQLSIAANSQLISFFVDCNFQPDNRQIFILSL